MIAGGLRRRPPGAAPRPAPAPRGAAPRDVARGLAPGRRGEGRRDDLWFDTFWAFGTIGSLLFVTQLTALVPVIVTGLLVLYFLWRRDRVPAMLAASSLMLALALFAVMSRFWSIDPGATTYYGIQFLITVMAGCAIGAGLDRERALRGVFLAFAAFAGAGLVFGRFVRWGGGAAGSSAFAGLAQAKNTAGDTAAVGALFSVAMIVLAWRNRNLPYGLLAFFVLPLQLFTLVVARSGGALLGAAIALPLFVVWAGSMLLPAAARVSVAVLSLLAAASAVATSGLWLRPLLDAVMKGLGKDSTLTGRTYLWDRATKLIDDRPLLGRGFAAFWRHGNLDAEGLWRKAAIQSRAGFNFHNTPTELLVHLGYVGLTLAAITLAVYGLSLLVRTMLRPDLPRVCWCALLVYEVGRMPFESLGSGPFHYTTALIAACFTLGAAGMSGFRERMAVRRASVVPSWRRRYYGRSVVQYPS
ncbi:O-antigen ligase family protein [Sphingomonas naphthae]|uniref:O-antigen ligase family protein n=1 Tax=Sphingomonas naphthae TaxID=1813468 RepID=A0ABY7TG04_9SPHN|nr:O-antigen ligase family protein [Sphingomonas naphthae]WCT71901.1 O-antigen ligase family protein [Sphingomonas naphthae]